jgi:hypothetical protein
MANERAKSLANQVLEDLNSGHKYYEDAEVLADLLKGALSPSAAKLAPTIAEAILDDRRGARYYADAEILAQFLEAKGVS